MAKKKKGSKKIEEKEFDLPEGLELLETSGWGNKMFSWLKNNFSAIILPIIALVILGGGIYLYSQQKGEGIDINEADLESGIVIDLEENEEDIEVEIAIDEEKIEEKKEVDVVAEEEQEVKEEKKGLFGKKKEKEEKDEEPKIVIKDAFKESAISGDGITHLARRALKSYLTAKKVTLTVEQKVFAEDYIQNQTGERMLETGEALTFSRSLVEEAVSQAQKLNAAQIENLGQYARLVPSLNY